MPTAGEEERSYLSQIKRVVVKLGTRVLVNEAGKPDKRRLREIVRQLVDLKTSGKQLVLVTSGAIGAGMQALGMKRRPTNLPDLQMAAAVGQSHLMSMYQEFFGKHKILVGQVLLSHDDLKDRVRHLNVRNTMVNLLRNNIVPIVNENDVVTVDEIKFGDNDLLASLVTLLVDGQALILLSSTDGLRSPVTPRRTRRVSYVPQITKEVLALASGKGSHLSTGGMESKLKAIQNVVSAGVLAMIADGRQAKILGQIFAAKDVGTLVGKTDPESRTVMAGRKRWIAFYHKPAGDLIVDEGAERALLNRGNSLLPIGIRAVRGKFPIGVVVNVLTKDEHLIARGLVEYSSDQIEQIKSCPTSEIKNILGFKDYDEVIHRDNIVVFLEGR